MSQEKILVIQGPNLNLLGERETVVYGAESLEEIHKKMAAEAGKLDVELVFYQSNHEGAILDRIHEAAKQGIKGIVINAGALTHTSIALMDALKGVKIPYTEIHISNVHAREPFRHHSYISANASGIVIGFGTVGYILALQGLVFRIRQL